MAKKLKLAEGISKPLVINSDYTYKVDVKLTKDGAKDGKQLFFGIKKNNSIDNELDDTYNKYIQSEPQVEGCVVQLYDSPYSNGKSIVYNLSENTTGSERLLAFSYNGTVLFKIKQAAKALEYNSEYVYVCVVPNISSDPKNIWLFAKFSDSLPTSDQLKTSYGTMTQLSPGYTGNDKKNGRTLYFSENTLPADKTIQELKDNGTLEVVQENTGGLTLSSYSTLIPYHLAQVNRTDGGTYNISALPDKSVAFKKEYLMCYIYGNNNVDSYQTTKFNIFDNSYYYGIYKYNSNVNKTKYHIKLYKVNTSPFNSLTSSLNLEAPIYLFVSQDTNEVLQYTENDQTYNYRKISCQSTLNKNYTFFLCEETNTLTSSKLNHKTISELKSMYNLTYKSGANLTHDDNDVIVNNISDHGIVNVWRSANKGTLTVNPNFPNNERVVAACLYNFYEDAIGTNAHSKYCPRYVINAAPTEAYATFTIDV